MVKLRVRTEFRKNLRLVALFFAVVFCIIAVRASFLQILRSDKWYDDLIIRHKIQLKPKRGTIYDCNREELAVSIKVKSLFARPHLIEEPLEAAHKLAGILNLSWQDIHKRLTEKRRFVWVQRKLTPQQVARITALEITGLEFEQETKRFYPNKELACQLLGFVGVDTQGLEGLEREYDGILKGRQGSVFADRDARGRDLFVEGFNPSKQVQQGHDIMLTIDKNIQYVAEKELQNAVDLSGAASGIAVVMDPLTGEVLALAMAPRFDPNSYSRYPDTTWRNRAVTDVFEPGSTFKTFVVAAALEENIVAPRDKFFCENGSFRVSNKTIHDLHPYGWLTVGNILKHSSNIGATKIGSHLGIDLLYQYIRRFGFGQETGVQFPIESSGIVPSPYRCPEHTQSTMTFGQGISVTALQLASAYCSIANGGVLMRPYFVKKIIDANGALIQETTPLIRHRIISEKTARIVRAMLKTVVSSGGTGMQATVSGFDVAGKTGTSQKTKGRRKGYIENKSVASFAGFAPADNPRITVVVIIDEPQKLTHGGQIAAPAFSRMTRTILNYLQVTPDTPVQPNYHVWQMPRTIDYKTEQIDANRTSS